jgi:hypothetical protein
MSTQRHREARPSQEGALERVAGHFSAVGTGNFGAASASIAHATEVTDHRDSSDQAFAKYDGTYEGIIY